MNHYDDRARLVFHHAREEGAKLGQHDIGPEHLLLGLLPAGGLAGQALAQAGLSLAALSEAVAALTGASRRALDHRLTPTILPQTREAMEQAAVIARGLGHENIGTEHILLGLLGQTGPSGPTLAQQVLQQLGVDITAMRNTLLASISIGHHNTADTAENTDTAANANQQSDANAKNAARSTMRMMIGEDVSRLREPMMEVFALAQAEALAQEALVVNSVHLLAGLMQGDNAAAGILAALDLGLEEVRSFKLSEVAATGPFSREVSRIFAAAMGLAWQEMAERRGLERLDQLNSQGFSLELSARHLLTAMLDTPASAACQILDQHCRQVLPRRVLHLLASQSRVS
jgi:ATP-dependent Clp protease ATP-binding subunit ClpA